MNSDEEYGKTSQKLMEDRVEKKNKIDTVSNQFSGPGECVALSCLVRYCALTI